MMNIRGYVANSLRMTVNPKNLSSILRSVGNTLISTADFLEKNPNVSIAIQNVGGGVANMIEGTSTSDISSSKFKKVLLIGGIVCVSSFVFTKIKT